MELALTLIGTKPMLQHNGRLSNPLDPYTRKLRQISGKRKKTDEDLVEMMHIEARGSAWETEDGILGVPTAAVWRSIQQAATAFKLGRDVERGLIVDDTVEPLVIGKKTYTVDDYLAKSMNHVDYRPVKVQTSRTMRARVRVAEGWRCTHKMEIDPDVLDLRNLQPVFARAGRLVGIGDWRPRYGTFELEVAEAKT